MYVIIHVATNRYYVGKSANPRQRWLQHVRGTSTRGSYIQRSIARHGSAAFRMRILQVCDTDEAAYEAESWWVSALQSNVEGIGFNLSLGGEGSRGFKVTDKFRAHASEVSKRRWARPGEREKNAKQARRVHTGLKRSAETCQRVSEALIGHPTSPEHRTKLSASGLGKLKPGTSAALKGRPKSAEHRAKIGAAHVGMKRSEEARRRMSEASRRRTDRNAGGGSGEPGS